MGKPLCSAQILLRMAATPMLHVPVINLAGALTMVASFVFPVLAMYVHNGLHWRV